MVGQDQRQFDAALAHTRPHAHPARGESRDRIGEAPAPAIGDGGRRGDDDAPGEVRLRSGRRGERAQIDAEMLIEAIEAFQRPVDIDGLVIARLAQQTDGALRLA
ncbi:hypothetical protein D3C85_1541270 [compost metagenome]